MPEIWHSSDAFTDDAIRQIDPTKKEHTPIFTYPTYTAPHSPLHAPHENVEKLYDRDTALALKKWAMVVVVRQEYCLGSCLEEDSPAWRLITSDFRCRDGLVIVTCSGFDRPVFRFLDPVP